ncbi:non-specific serine/threonine protein kinase [Ranunculus cassubicifolius]
MKSSILFLCVVVLLFLQLVKPDLDSDKTALLALHSRYGLHSFNWTASDASPCKWQGVECENGRVSVLRLPGSSLVGHLESNVLGNLTGLRTLSIRFNALTGELPSDLSRCVDLRNLYLQGNKFSGEIPAFLYGLTNLVRLNLAGNNFSGEISKDVNNLVRLKTLYLEQNQLTGKIPQMNKLGFDQFNVSFNQLTGSIPSSLRNQKRESFLGNSLNGCPIDEGSCLKKKKKLSGGAIAGIIIGAVIGFLLLLLILFFCCVKKRKSKPADNATSKSVQEVEAVGKKEIENSSSTEGPVGKAKGESLSNAKHLVFCRNATKNFDLEDLLRASAEVLGNGTFGTAYKAVLEFNVIVAVKRLKDVTIPEPEFREKIEKVGSMDHKNLVPLRAYYYSRDEKLLVCDYMHMGSLSALLHGNRGAGRTPLNWETRSGIALGAARGIEYLHLQGSTVSHGNIKSSNILLTSSYEARVSDFGLAHLVGPSSTPNRVTGYRAPEVTDARKVSQKADVYSFGVLLLELLTGKAPSQAVTNDEGVDLPRWVQSVVREEWTSEVFDLELLRYQNVEEDMVQLLQLAVDCVAQYPDKRPSMSEVVHRIEELCRSSPDLDAPRDLFDDAENGSS